MTWEGCCAWHLALRGRTAALERLLCRKSMGPVDAGCLLGVNLPLLVMMAQPCSSPGSGQGAGQGCPPGATCHAAGNCLLLVVNYFLLCRLFACHHLVLCCFFVSLIFCFLDEVESSVLCPVSVLVEADKYRAWVVVCPEPKRWGPGWILCPLADLEEACRSMPCVLSSREHRLGFQLAYEAVLSAVEFSEHVAFLRKKERHCCFAFGRKRRGCWRPRQCLVLFLVGWKVAFLLFLRKCHYPNSDWWTQGKVEGWAEEWVLWKMDQKTISRMGHLKKGLIIKEKILCFTKNHSVTPLLCRPGCCPGQVLADRVL